MNLCNMKQALMTRPVSQPTQYANAMKNQYAAKHQSGFSLVELLTTVSIIAILAAIAIPNIGSISSEANNTKNKRNAQTIVGTYSAGEAAGVSWPAGTVSTKVTAILAGQKPASGVFATTTFKVTLTPEEAALTYRFIRTDARGNLYLDADGNQDPSGL
jgi:prepilin-type N-terminal cleavage/methylation domain-containing protein